MLSRDEVPNFLSCYRKQMQVPALNEPSDSPNPQGWTKECTLPYHVVTYFVGKKKWESVGEKS